MSTMPPNPFIVSVPSSEKALALVRSDPKLLAKLGFDKPEELTHFNLPTYLIAFKQYAMLFQVAEVKTKEQEGIYEFHVMCPKSSIKANRVLSLGAIKWIFTEIEPRPKSLVTSCPEGKIANMCRKFGALEVKKEKGTVYFVLPFSIVKSLL